MFHIVSGINYLRSSRAIRSSFNLRSKCSLRGGIAFLGLILYGVWWITVGTLSDAIWAGAPPPASSETAHPGEHKKIGKAACKDCHGELVKKKQIHPPVADSCDSCHEFTEKGEVAQVKLAMEGNQLCFTCHSEKQDELKAGKTMHPAVDAGCTSCHDPHAADSSPLLKINGNDLCFTCHPDKEEALKNKKFAHAPAKDLGCTSCHNPHASGFPVLLKAEINTACLSCHQMPSETGKVRPDKTAFLSASKVPLEYPNKAKKVILGSDGRGHPYLGHPVTGVDDPSQKNKRLNCISCHDPHAGNMPQMFKKDLRGQALCDTCHK